MGKAKSASPPASPASEGPRRLTGEQVDTFYREGYLLLSRVVPADVCEAVVAADDRDYVSGSFWSPRIFDHDHPQVDAAIHRVLTEPAVMDVVEDLLEAPARVYYGMLAVVPAHGGRGLPWHQDNMYSTLLGRALNSFVALRDIDPDMAILWVAPRSHRAGVQASHAADTHEGHRQANAEPEGGVPLPALKQGDICVFDRMTLHRSLKNETDVHRYAYAAQYMEERARTAETGQRDPKRMLARDLAAQIDQALRTGAGSA